MLLDIPDPEQYDVSPETGFLPAELPPDFLPHPYYAQWNYVAQNMHELLKRKLLRPVVDGMNVVTCNRLETVSQLRSAYSTLAFISHAYIWGGESPAEVVPPSISIPFLAVCQILELPPVATYAAVVLWNFKPLFSAERLDRLENLTTIMTFTGAVDESWFYLISVAIEARGGQLISVVLETIRCVRVKDTLSVINHLRQLLAGLEELPALLQRMYERCDPHFFYHRLRPFLAGSKNVSRAGLPHGVVFDDGSGRLQSVQYSGGSNAQSSLIQFFDIALGITHQPTSPGATRPSKGDAVRPDVRDRTASEPKHGPFQPKEESNFIMDMRQYMPGPHRRFLDHLTCVANIREFVKANPGNEALSSSYNACITALVAFRNVHLQIVSRYVVLPSRKVLDRPKNTSTTTTTHHQGVVSLRRSGDDDDILGARSGAEALENLTGTGGTTLIPFLKQVRDETRQCVRRRRPGAAMAIERNTDIRQAMSMQ